MIKLYKQLGETPLEALKRLRRQRPELAEARLSYAGRLDPLASGILLILVGEENDRRESFLSADKTYVFKALFGVSTDTFDLLGIPQAVDKSLLSSESKIDINASTLKDVANQFEGGWEMTYPPYSSKTVNWKGEQVPLWKIARAGKIKEVNLPTKEVQIHDLQLQKTERRKKNYIIYYIINQIEKVSGDFRQKEIITKWKQELANVDENTTFQLATFRVHCSAGTYVRRLSDSIGEELDVPSTTFAITRTDIS